MVKKISYMGENNSSKIVRKIDAFLMGFYSKLPFTYIGLIRAAFGEILHSKEKITLLDIGCADGNTALILKLHETFEITGVEIFKPYVDLAMKRGIYKKVIRADIRKLKTKDNFDIVMALNILEHFNKEEARKILKKIENMARKKIIIVIPIGKHPQESYDNNKYQEHKSFWEVKEMQSLGYKIKSQGLKVLWGHGNVVKKYKLFCYVFFILSNLFYPILLIKPQWGTYMVCVKDK